MSSSSLFVRDKAKERLEALEIVRSELVPLSSRQALRRVKIISTLVVLNAFLRRVSCPTARKAS